MQCVKLIFNDDGNIVTIVDSNNINWFYNQKEHSLIVEGDDTENGGYDMIPNLTKAIKFLIAEGYLFEDEPDEICYN